MDEKIISCGLTLDEIKGLARTVKENELGKIKIKNGNDEIVIEGARKVVSSVDSQPVIVSQNTSVADVVENTENNKNLVKGNIVKSPIVGTFYSSPAPDKPSFVKIGDKVKKGDVIMIIESMKLMNEVQSDFDGEVLDILVDSGQAVEYDQPIMIIG
ncbi:MAG: acetyl-CoA carboxylase biotin carboxyl carrier protein [Oscillospiraceae bacterium]|nr:acetyl-CoA carboxylase biotin carboxyl carrier protein [Oscillospiraceae bacterium]